MAERRMFAKTIVLSDAFLDMPMSARCLYFTLGMLADDDGFVNAPRSIMRQCGASDDDMKILIAKKFVLLFDSGVIVIKHWRINNYLRNDRYTATKYVDEKAQLTVDGKGAYHRDAFCVGTPIEQIETIGEDNRTVRKQAYEDSDLPNNFDNKIREAFYGKPCPICGTKMQRYRDECGVISEARMPSIQHNTPISKGGKHELSNISVICHSCNVTIKDKPTGPLNNSEVVEEWQKISGIPNNGIPSIGKDRLGKDSIGDRKKEDAYASKKERAEHHFDPPTIEDVEAYCAEQGFTETDADDFVNFYEKKGWFVGKTRMKDWMAAVRNWENTERKRRGLPSIGQMRKEKAAQGNKPDLVEYPTGSGRMIPINQARREANLDNAYREYPPGSGSFLPPWEIANLEVCKGGGNT